MMDTIHDFEELLIIFNEYNVRYLIVGGIAFIYYAKPRYTKDLDLWIEPAIENIKNANAALLEFGSNQLLDASDLDKVTSIGVEPHRIDFIMEFTDKKFPAEWEKREVHKYGNIEANWINIETLYDIKKSIDVPKHQSDALDLKHVIDMRKNKDKN